MVEPHKLYGDYNREDVDENGLPTWQYVEGRCAKASPYSDIPDLVRFIYEFEPAGSTDMDFRGWLASALHDARKQGEKTHLKRHKGACS